MDPVTMAVIAGGSAVMKGYGDWKKNQPAKTKPISPGEIQGYMSPVQGTINQMQAGANQMMGIGQQMMDPGSQRNQAMKNQFMEQNASQQALSALLNRRQAAALGQNSAITGAQNRMSMAQGGRAAMDAFGRQVNQNFMQGVGVLGNAQSLLGNVGKMQFGIQENIAQTAIAQREAQRAQEVAKNKAQGAFWSNMGQGLGSFGTASMGGM